MAPSSPIAFEQGDVVDARYRVEGDLAEGGMSHLYRANDLQTDETIALKILKPDLAIDSQAVQRFWREAEILRRLNHPAIVAVRGTGELEHGGLYIAMEFLAGETLGAWMRRGRLNPSELSPVVTGTAVGLHAAHEASVVHRDLKPDNIFLTYPGEEGRVQVKILDFGISKLHDADRITRTGQVLGTPRYMAPEQLIADRNLDHRVDIYALGTILYEALAGRPPFIAKNPSQLIIAILRGDKTALNAYRPDLPESLVETVARAMAPLSDDRFNDALDLANSWVDAVRGVTRPKTVVTEGGDG